MNRNGAFHFGLEAEFLLVDAQTFDPLWHPQLEFRELRAIVEAIPAGDFPNDGLDIEPLHRQPLPFVIEGYHLPDPELKPVDMLAKGIEIRTPVCASIEDCLAALATLHRRMQRALAERGYRAAVLSFHPTQSHFKGPQNKRRHDFWQWAMEAMTTYGPDVNVSVPSELGQRLDLEDLDAKVNYYAPALTALSLASPLYDGGLWRIRGHVGKSVRTYHRSALAPAIEIHPDENLRLEFKTFDMSRSLEDYRNYFLLWLALILDDGLPGRATAETRIYDMGQVARSGLDAETVRARCGEVLARAPAVLDHWGFDPAPLRSFQERLDTGRLPADDIIALYEREQCVSGVLRHLCDLE
jgi:Glutamate-cysteine ligase family 2(GCS2)